MSLPAHVIADIIPTVFTDDDGTSWLAWSNRQCYIAKLKPNMIDIDGPIREITPPHFVEGPWLHKRGKLYYLSYASMTLPHRAPSTYRIQRRQASPDPGPTAAC
ncbi:family 43 glycosylhydrolase [Massilia pseudoviolaceinigra]|uniref:family 43 glycosylhydrolase n=1 Tax=Massilia pseudoviolaceinigra TaxID=3057165 RepID=UPI0027965E17|nr:family 43 glycosylhydrolase [Massilia sp. CCM 9206]MDQ1919166.1 family 43 glycosylhydrolase [Massilia sp. CCM 9206]